MGMKLGRNKYGPDKTGMGTGVGGGDGQVNIDRVRDLFTATPNQSCRGASPVLGVRMCA